MKYRKRFAHSSSKKGVSKSAGFTIFEVLIVVGIVVLLGGSALFASMASFHGSSFHADRNTFVAVLQRARAEAMNNICIGGNCTDGTSHGVKILSDNTITLFQGPAYSTRDPSADSVFKLDVATTSGASEFVFSQLSGSSSFTTVVLDDQAGHISTITVSVAGQIAWTH
ncbi:hypothetical protein HZC00_03085 [Candidatus Kaiserbacteria bacterium]|nr:hypothetical protein [Candidatus Kaiserbacteria bacterium]